MSEMDISRFLFDGGHIRADKTIRHNAFTPPKNYRLSVYKTDTLTAAQVYEIGLQYVAPLRGKPIKGVAQVHSGLVGAIGLSIDNDGVPHSRHSNIIGWSEDSSKDRILAMKLASEAVLLAASSN